MARKVETLVITLEHIDDARRHGACGEAMAWLNLNRGATLGHMAKANKEWLRWAARCVTFADPKIRSALWAMTGIRRVTRPAGGHIISEPRGKNTVEHEGRDFDGTFLYWLTDKRFPRRRFESMSKLRSALRKRKKAA